MKNKKISLKRLALLPVLTVFTTLAFTSCTEKNGDRPKDRPIAVRAMKPVMTDMQNRLSYVGTVQANREVRVIAQVQGTVIKLPKPAGAAIQIGELVAEIDVPDLRASVERLAAERDYWCRRQDSDQRLVQAEALPAEQAEASLRACRSAKAALAEVEAKLAKAKEHSPISGKVLAWLVEPGQHVMPGQPILLLGDNNLEIHVEVVEEDLRSGIQIGTLAQVRDWQGNELQTKVMEVAPVTSGAARTFTVEMPMPSPDNHREFLRIGASMRVDFILAAKRSAIAVPVEAIIRQGDKTHVFLIRQERALKKEITPGIEQDGLIEVSFDWNGEDWVAVSNLGSLKDSVEVFPVEIEYARQ